jgi:hypothetical protein
MIFPSLVTKLNVWSGRNARANSQRSGTFSN